MNCRERALRAIKFERPDRIPLSYSVLPFQLFKYGQACIDLCRKHPNDFYDVDAVLKLPKRDTAHYRPDGTYYNETTDEWGSVWVQHKEGISGEVKQPVLDDWAKLKNFPFPRVPNSSAADRQRIKEEVKRQKEHYVGWGGAGSFFEQMQWLRGTPDLFMDIASECPEVEELADRLLTEWTLPQIELALEAGVDVVGFGDDWGSQQQLLINPAAWRKLFKPRYRKMFELVHQGGAVAWMHSDGQTIDIMPDWIEIGLDVLNPQLSCMDMRAIQRICAGQLCITGDIDRQRTLPFGTPAEVRAYLREVTRVFGAPAGGFIYTLGIHDVPLENMAAALETIDAVRDLS